MLRVLSKEEIEEQNKEIMEWASKRKLFLWNLRNNLPDVPKDDE